MKKSEGIELTNDVDEALIELGTMDDTENIVWRERLRSVPDMTYLHEKDFTPVFTDHKMFCLPMGQLTKEEILKEGLAGGLYYKYYVSGKQFEDVREGFIPKNADRIIHRGISFEVEKEKTIQVGEVNILYVVYAKESPLGVQTEDYREKTDPYFEYDASQEVDATNDVVDNSNLFVDYPARVEITGEFPILVWGSDSNFCYKTNDMGEPVVYTITPGTYTMEEFITAFKPVNVEIVQDSGKYYLQTTKLGKEVSLAVVVTTDSINDLIGVPVGIYYGREELRI